MKPPSSARIRRRRTAVVDVSVDIARPPEPVFDDCGDHRDERAWNSHRRAVAKIGDAELGSSIPTPIGTQDMP
jgi:hypothetical protein